MRLVICKFQHSDCQESSEKKPLGLWEYFLHDKKIGPTLDPQIEIITQKKDKGIVTYPGYQISIFCLDIFCFCKSDKKFGIERYFGETVSNWSTSAIVDL